MDNLDCKYILDILQKNEESIEVKTFYIRENIFITNMNSMEISINDNTEYGRIEKYILKINNKKIQFLICLKNRLFGKLKIKKVCISSDEYSSYVVLDGNENELHNFLISFVNKSINRHFNEALQGEQNE